MTILAMIGAAIAYIAYEYWTAPIGYEDEKGFHYGEPD